MSRPNILLLTVDTLRADRLGATDRTQSLTPNLDRLAARGVRFDQAITGGSWTQAAFPVIMTSTPASMYGGCLGPLGAERPSPIAALAEAGYATAGFSTSPLLSRTYRYDQGFSHFVDLLPDESDPALRHRRGGQFLLRQPLTHQVSRLLGKRTRPAALYVTAEELNTAALAWMRDAEQPYFAWLHYMDVHWPYHRETTLTKAGDVARAWRDLADMHSAAQDGSRLSTAEKAHFIRLYEEAVAYTDEQIGRLLGELQRNGHLDNTMVVVVADHGEEFVEHGRWGHWENNLYDEILRVPLIIAAPGGPQGRVVTKQVRTMDIMPTLLDLADVNAPPQMQGDSLAPLFADHSAEQYEPGVAIAEMWRDHWHIIAVRSETVKYIWDSRENSPQLYDLRKDPGEQHNIAADHPDVVADLHAYVDLRLKEMQESKPAEESSEPELDEDVVARLRGLGYMD